MLNKYTGGKNNDIINLISTGKETKEKKEETSNNAGPVRRNMMFLKNIEKQDLSKKSEFKNHNENDPEFNL